MNRFRDGPILFYLLAWCLLPAQFLLGQTNEGHLELTIIDQATHRPVPCRIHLKNSARKPVLAAGLPAWRDHFVCDGKVRMPLTAGNYSYEIERGPEYRRATGSFTITGTNNETITVTMGRGADLAAEGWWSGDLHVHRPVQEIELLMEAEDLHVAPVMTWWNKQNLWSKQPLLSKPLVRFDGNRFYQLMAGEDEREGGALMFFNLSEPLAIAGASREYPSPMKFVAEARQHPGVWIDVEKPFWWDLPVWVASGQIDSIGLANNHMCRDQMYENEAWGKPRDAQRLPPPRGNGFWSQEIYYHLLNCGLRIPPSAGSASGVLPNPVGYNRVYVYVGKELTYEEWWEGLRAGRSFVSNGPLLRCRVNGELPGHVFKSAKSKELGLKIESLISQDTISSIEIIKDGRIERVVPFGTRQKTGKLGALKFGESGWFLIRVVAENPKTFRFASTAPFYVEIGAQPRRISRASAQFFLDWVRERAQRVKLEDPTERREVLQYHYEAESFWQDMLRRANAE